MKQFILFVCLLASSAALSSCSKSSDPDPVVVGTWTLDRVRTTGFVGAYATAGYNADNDPLTVFGIQDIYVIKNDKTYSETRHSSGAVSDYTGTWDYTSTTLTLKDNLGNTYTYTPDATKTPIQLLGTVNTEGDSLTNPSTGKVELVNYNYQFIYVKQ